MLRAAFLTVVIVCVASPSGFGQGAVPEWHMVYTPSHRASYVKEWKYQFPNHHSTRWIIALRYPPTLAWSRNVVGKAELLTSTGWKPFQEVTEGSREKRHACRRLQADDPIAERLYRTHQLHRDDLSSTAQEGQTHDASFSAFGRGEGCFPGRNGHLRLQRTQCQEMDE